MFDQLSDPIAYGNRTGAHQPWPRPLENTLDLSHAALVNKLVPWCPWLLSGALGVLSGSKEMNIK